MARSHGEGASLGSTGLVLAALAATVGCAPVDRRKAHLMDLIAALWQIPDLDPRVAISGQTNSLGEAFRWVGPGYWLRALGTVSILLGALGLLLSAGGTRRAPGAPGR